MILVSLINTCLTYTFVINGRYRKATHGQIQGVTNDWKYDASCSLTSLPVSDLEIFKRLMCVAQSVHV
jgi:hypothetical protein